MILTGNRQNIVILLISCTFIIVFTNPAAVQQFPKPSGYVNDFAGKLSQPVKSQLERLAVELESKTGAELVLVTMKTIGDNDYTDYANRLFENWQIGKQGKDNGVLILNVIDKRELRIEVGYGFEGVKYVG